VELQRASDGRSEFDTVKFGAFSLIIFIGVRAETFFLRLLPQFICWSIGEVCFSGLPHGNPLSALLLMIRRSFLALSDGPSFGQVAERLRA